MLCLIVEIVQYLKPLPPLLYKSTFSLYTILLPKKVSFYTTTSYYCTCTTYYTLYPTFFVHIFFFVVVLLFSTATLLHFFVFVLHTFCIIFFLSFMNKRTVFSLLFLFLFDIFFSLILVIIVRYTISIFSHFLSRIQKAPSTMTSWQGAKATLLSIANNFLFSNEFEGFTESNNQFTIFN